MHMSIILTAVRKAYWACFHVYLPRDRHDELTFFIEAGAP
jgi:hypothetical protein